MYIGTAKLFNSITAYGNKTESNDNMAIRLANNQVKNQAEQADLSLREDLRNKKMMMSIKDGPLKKLSNDSLIDRGLSVVRGVYDAFQKSFDASREQYIDPMLDQMSEYEKRLEAAKADPNADPSDMELLQSEIDFLQKRIQDTTNRFIDQYSKFYGGFLKGTVELYNKATDGQFEKMLSHYVATPDGQSGLLELSAKGLGLDQLEGSSSDIRKKFAEANKRYEQFQETLEKAQNDFRKSVGLQGNPYNETLKLLQQSDQLDLLDRLLTEADSGSLPDMNQLERINEIQDVKVENRFQGFDKIV